LILIAGGCRKALAPNIDRNAAPETWVTAAPLDTLMTVRGTPPLLVPIPVRFHLHWAGSDRDGYVAGFYYAVVETLPIPEPGFPNLPPLPGPKASDYRFISSTDSIFIFNVSEGATDRQHGFYIYAVDNLGKADPTPARFVFVARDRFPPKPRIDMARAVGTVYRLLPNGSVVPEVRTFDITDSLIPGGTRAPSDTVPSNSTLTFRWHGEPQIPGSIVTGYRYKLEEPDYVVTDSTVREKVYTPPIPSNVRVFRLRAVDQASGTDEVTRRFQYNFAPDTWIAGPDRAQCASCQTSARGQPYVLAPFPSPLPPIAGSYLSPDSIGVMPALRPDRKTFFEIYRDSVFIRSEGDTVHMNSWVVMHFGGLDIDSPYSIDATPLSPGYVPGPVTTAGPPNGSPIGFHTTVSIRSSPTGRTIIQGQSGLFPVFNPNSQFDNPRVAAYLPMFQAGRVFVVPQAEDGDRTLDRRIPDGRLLVDAIENMTASDYERTLGGKVMTFHVNRPPVFRVSQPLFQPSPSRIDTFTTNSWHMQFYTDDEDPFVQGTPPGGPTPVTSTSPKPLRLRISVLGLHTNGDSLRYSDGLTYINDPVLDYFIPPGLGLAPGRAIVNVELCDCFTCDDTYGGRCVNLQIPVEYRPSVLLDRPISQGPGQGGLSSGGIQR
jgi:hypothetical protein